MLKISPLPLLALTLLSGGCAVHASGSARATASSSGGTADASERGARDDRGASAGERPAPSRPAPAPSEPTDEPVADEPPPAEPAAPSLAAADPIRCAGKDEVTLAGVAIDGGAGPAVRATGQCRVRIEGSTLASTGVAISVAGKAQVELVECAVRGGDEAIVATGNGAVRLEGGQLEGAAVAKGNGRVDQDGAPVARR